MAIPEVLQVSAELILQHLPYGPDNVDRVAHRTVKQPIAIKPYDAKWPGLFQILHDRIRHALGATALLTSHVGSTSVPGLPAKECIDIDLVVADVHDEATYVPQLESAGFRFLFREPAWYDHRFFVCEEPELSCNLHVWPPHCPEAARHFIFRNWLREHADDRKLYADAKLGAADQTIRAGETMVEYNERKEEVIRQILHRALQALGYIA